MKGIAIVKAELLNRKNADNTVSNVLDKNGLPAVILVPLAGQLPSKRTVSGTFAQRNQIFEGSCYAVEYTEGEVDPDPKIGRTFQFNNLGSVGVLDIIKAKKELGEGTLVDVNTPAPSNP